MKKICSFFVCSMMLLNLVIGAGAVDNSSFSINMEGETVAVGDSATSPEPASEENLEVPIDKDSETALVSPENMTISTMDSPEEVDLTETNIEENGYTVIASENPISAPLNPSSVQTIDLQSVGQKMLSAAELPENQPPIGTPELIIENPDSMKNGQYTTDSKFLIVTSYNGQDLVSDPEGGPLNLTFNSSFPAGYFSAFDNGLYKGFEVHMFHIGYYVLNFAFTDQVGDMSDNMWTMNFDIIRRGDYTILEDSFSSATDMKEYPITVDYSKESSYSIAIMRTGTCGANVQVLDSDGNSVGSTFINSQASTQSVASGITLKKSADGTDVCNYVIKVSTTQSFFDKCADTSDTRYQIAYGGKSQVKYFFEDVTSNTKTAYYKTKRDLQELGNTYESYTGAVSDYGNWYKMVAQGTETVTMALNKANKINFKIVDVNSMQTLTGKCCWSSSSTSKSESARWWMD